MTSEPDLLVAPLWERMERLGADGRYEEAADTRDRLSTLVDALARQRRFDQMRAARRVVIDIGAAGSIELRRGRLTRLREPIEAGALPLDDGWRAVEATPPDPGPPDAGPLDPGLADELTLIARWLDRNAGTARLAEVSGVWASQSRWVAPQVDLLKAARR
jgi:DNA polymerase-3 subunit epsilon